MNLQIALFLVFVLVVVVQDLAVIILVIHLACKQKVYVTSQILSLPLHEEGEAQPTWQGGVVVALVLLLVNVGLIT